MEWVLENILLVACVAALIFALLIPRQVWKFLFWALAVVISGSDPGATADAAEVMLELALLGTFLATPGAHRDRSVPLDRDVLAQARRELQRDPRALSSARYHRPGTMRRARACLMLTR